MATNAFLTSGSYLQIGNGASPEVFSTISEVVSVGDFGLENPLINVTHLGSTAQEYISGLPDGVSFDITVNYYPTDTSHVALMSAATNRTKPNFKFAISSSPIKTFSFAALVTAYKLPAAVNAAFQMRFTMKISGSITGPA